MTTTIIASTGPVESIVHEALRPFGEIHVASESTLDALLPMLPNAIAVIVRGGGSFPERALEAAPQLKVIGRSGAGYDGIAVKAATARRIPIVYTPGANARAVAEAAMTWMLALSKHIFFWDRQLKAGNWGSRDDWPGGDLEGATLGIVGFGRIGQQLAHLARPFDMEILAYDPFPQVESAQRLHVTLVNLDELMQRSDFISLHAAATEENRGLINRRRLQSVRPGAYLINLARGALIESLDVLHEALNEGRLAGVALDAFEPEPPDCSHPLFQHPQCLTAPHSMAMTRGAMRKVFQSMATDMAAVLSGKTPRFVVNPEVLTS